MFDRMAVKARNFSFFAYIFCNHLYRKWNPDKSTVFGLLCMLISSIVFPVVVCYLFYKDPTYIEQTILIYMAVSIWCTSLLILINQKTFNRVKSETKYAYRLMKFIMTCHVTFINQYKKWVKNHLVRKNKHKEFEKYDVCVVDTILMQICNLYFENINTKLKENIPLVVSVDRIKELSTDKQFKDFYSSIFFNIEGKEEQCSLDVITIKVFDAVMDTLYTKSWFEEYWDNENGCKFIKFIINNWFENIASFNTYKFIERDQALAIGSNM